MRLTTYLFAILMVLITIKYVVPQIGNSIISRTQITAKQIKEGNSYVR
jgi:hypothetical protein